MLYYTLKLLWDLFNAYNNYLIFLTVIYIKHVDILSFHCVVLYSIGTVGFIYLHIATFIKHFILRGKCALYSNTFFFIFHLFIHYFF